MKHQKGFAHAALLVIGLVIVILGLLGFVFWQNFIRQDSDTQNNINTETQSETPPPTVQLLDGKTDNDLGQSLSFKYPTDWTLKNTKETAEDGMTGEKWLSKNISTITSPDGKYVVRYTIALNGGIGGACAPPEHGTFTKIQATELPALKQISSQSGKQYVLETESVFQGNYTRTTFIVNKTAAPKVGDSVCAATQTYVKLGTFEEYPVNLMEAKIIVKDHIDPTTDRAALTAAYETEYYKAARDILLSTKN